MGKIEEAAEELEQLKAEVAESVNRHEAVLLRFVNRASNRTQAPAPELYDAAKEITAALARWKKAAAVFAVGVVRQDARRTRRRRANGE